jgi:hypothetical protein
LIDWLEAWSYNLVLLEEYPLSDVQAAVRTVSAAVRDHAGSAERRLAELPPRGEEFARGVRLVRNDHVWFVTSLEQFGWFLRVVESEDQGGHRQALGQYGRILAEALRRHRRDERWLEGKEEFGRTGTAPRSGKP